MITTNQTRNKSSQILAEIAIFTALAAVLRVISIYTMPQGGSITLAAMTPIIWLSLRRGPKAGIAAGILYSVIELMLFPCIVNPIQVLFDYPLAFGVLGVAAFFPNKPILGSTIAIACRFLAHFVSGIVWWAAIAAPSVNPIVYSSIYNGSYLLPELVISGIVLFLLHKCKVLKVYM